MLRAPSLVREYDEYVSVDPVFVQAPEIPDDDVAEEQQAAFVEAFKEYRAKVRACRKTGDWTPLLAPERTLNEATKFVLGQVDRHVWRDLLDRNALPPGAPGRVGNALLCALLFRLAVQNIVGADCKVERERDDKYGVVMAHPRVVDYLDAINPLIVSELGAAIAERLRGVDPLSRKG